MIFSFPQQPGRFYDTRLDEAVANEPFVVLNFNFVVQFLVVRFRTKNRVTTEVTRIRVIFRSYTEQNFILNLNKR